MSENTQFYDKEDLIYSYRWSQYSEKDPRISGDPDNTWLDRAQGGEILYLINLFAAKRSFTSKHSGSKIEKMLNLYVPADINTQMEVINWIEERWFDFI
jgi:hypothetical protein